MGVLNLVDVPMSNEEREQRNLLTQKLDEYKNHFGCIFTSLGFTIPEIIEGVDKCIKHNRKWEGFIVPELDYDEVEI